jgi:hypothetical protein
MSKKLYHSFAYQLKSCTYQEGCGVNVIVFTGLFVLQQETKEKNYVFCICWICVAGIPHKK